MAKKGSRQKAVGSMQKAVAIGDRRPQPDAAMEPAESTGTAVADPRSRLTAGGIPEIQVAANGGQGIKPPAAVHDRTPTDTAVADPQESGVRGQQPEPAPPAAESCARCGPVTAGLDIVINPATGMCISCMEAAAYESPAPNPQPEILSVTIEIPVGPLGDGHQARHVEAQLRTPRERATMRRIFAGLDLSGARTADGRVVASNGHAIRWLIEQVAAAVEG